MFALPEIPPLFEAFVVTVLFGFVIGLEVHSYRRASNQDLGFGTTRTLTLLAVMGFVLTALDPQLWLFTAGMLVIALLLMLQYWHRLAAGEQSLLPTFIALLVYLVGPLALQQPLWLLILYVVVVLLLLSEKPLIRKFSDNIHSVEAITLAKFLIMAGLILPMLPDQPIASFISVSYSQLWLSVVVVSGISYLSYLMQTYFFPNAGVLLTGILGGLYSSTSTTAVLSRRARTTTNSGNQLYASAMMYLRLMLLFLLLGHTNIVRQLIIPFAVLITGSVILAWWLYRQGNHAQPQLQDSSRPIHHPLEFSTAILFAGLFIFFAGVTQAVIEQFGLAGLHNLSFLVGFSDIDPFILALLAGKYSIDTHIIATAILVATASNNVLKAMYALVIARNRNV
ncbi:MAG: DUF4010 domain-containing protein, partial [Sulfuriferula sp.]